METRVVHPSLKPVWVWYAIAGVAIVAGVWIYNSSDQLMDNAALADGHPGAAPHRSH